MIEKHGGAVLIIALGILAFALGVSCFRDIVGSKPECHHEYVSVTVSIDDGAGLAVCGHISGKFKAWRCIHCPSLRLDDPLKAQYACDRCGKKFVGIFVPKGNP